MRVQGSTHRRLYPRFEGPFRIGTCQDGAEAWQLALTERRAGGGRRLSHAMQDVAFSGFGLTAHLFRAQFWEMIGRLVVITVSLLIASTPRVTAQRSVKIGGTLSFAAFQGTNRLVNAERKYDFECVVGGGKWVITSKFLNNAIERFSFDGTNVYRVLEYTAPPIAMRALQNEENATSPVLLSSESVDQLNKKKFLTISPGPLPLGNAGVNVPWLAFCSGDYLKSSGRIIPLLIGEARHDPTAFGYDDETVIFEGELGLPKVVTLRESRERFASSLDDPRIFQRRKGRGMVPMAVDGRIAFTYVAARVTNYHGAMIPLAFACEQFSYGAGGMVNVRTTGSGEVSSIVESPPPDADPFGKGATYRVVDLRFRSAERLLDSIQYQWSKPTLPGTNDPVLQKQFESNAQERPSRR